jgi:hypothetical protein
MNLRLGGVFCVVATAAGCLPLPSAELSGPDCVVAGTVASLDASKSAPGRRPIHSYRFDFGDGSAVIVGPGALTTHRYANPGTYDVTVEVTDEDGNQARAAHRVGVEPDALACGVALEGTGKLSVDACLFDGVEDCHMVLGTLALNTTESRPLRLTNIGQGPLELTSVNILEASGAFTVRMEGDTLVLPGQSVTARITFSPTRPGRVGATLRIRSDAANQPTTNADRSIHVALEGVTTGEMFPRLTVTPRRCDLGEVTITPAGTPSATCGVTAWSTGTAPLQLLGVTLNGSAFSMEAPVTPATLAPGEFLDVPVRYTVTLAREDTGTLVFQSDDGLRPEWEVPLRARGVIPPPTPVVTVKRVNGVDVLGGALPQLHPGDDVELDGTGSAASAQGTIAGHRWEVDGPPGSLVQTAVASGEALRITHLEGSAQVNGVDLPGRYTVRLFVTDNRGVESPQPASLTLDVVPTAPLHIQLTWDAADADVDLHLVRGAVRANTFTQEDCHYATCAPNAGSPLDWAPGTGAEPVLQLDDQTGTGAEALTWTAPLPGRYAVAAHVFKLGAGTPEPISARLRVWILQQLVLDEPAQLTCGTVWQAALLEWSATGAAITPQDTRWDQPTMQCP